MLRKVVRSLLAGDSPGQLAAGFTIGMIIGLMPKGNLIALSLCVLLFSLRCNKGLRPRGRDCVFVRRAWTDPFAHKIGLYALTLDSMQATYASTFNLPLGPWLGFNNTVVTGSLLMGLYVAYPVYWVMRISLTGVRSAVRQPPTPRAGHRRRAPTEGRRMSRSLRWQILVPRLLLVGGRAARRAVRARPRRAIGSRFDPAKRRSAFRWMSAPRAYRCWIDQVVLNDLRLANPRHPAESLLEADRCELDVATKPLLQKQAVVTRGRVTGLRFSTPDASSQHRFHDNRRNTEHHMVPATKPTPLPRNGLPISPSASSKARPISSNPSDEPKRFVPIGRRQSAALEARGAATWIERVAESATGRRSRPNESVAER